MCCRSYRRRRQPALHGANGRSGQHLLMPRSLINGCYASGNSVLTPPAYGTYGTVGKNIFRNPNFRTWDFSVTKDFKIKERLTAQFRGELFNVLNHPVFGQVDSGHLTNNDPSTGQPWPSQRNPGPSRRKPGARLGKRPRRSVGLEANLLSPAESSDRVLSCVSIAVEAGVDYARL